MGRTLSAREGASRARIRRRGTAVRTRALRLAVAAGVVALAALVVGLVFSGTSNRLATGIRVGGVPVGGLTRSQAIARLQGRTARLQSVPVTFVAGSDRFAVRPEELGVVPDWRRAVDQALQRGGGFAVARGYRRLGLRFGPVDFEPRVKAYDAAVAYEIDQLASKIDRKHVDARLVRHGLSITVAPGEIGRRLDRSAATRIVVDALAGFSRTPVELPVSVDRPSVTVADLAETRSLARRVVSAPVQLRRGSAGLVLSREIGRAHV